MKKLFLIFPLLLMACSGASNGPLYNGIKTPGKGFSTIVVYRPKEVWEDKGKAETQINGKLTCNIHNEAFVVLIDAAGAASITASRWGEPGTSRYNFQAEQGKIYYIRLDGKKERLNAFLLGGMAGMLIQEGLSDKGGPYDIIQIDPYKAKTELIGMRQDCP